MSTMDDKKLRRLLGEIADDVSPHRGVPASLEKRVHRRVTINSALIGAMVIALAVGTFATMRTLGPAKTPRPFGGSTSPTPSAIASCTSGQLRAIGSMDGAAGSRIGTIELRNYSDKSCTLKGTPAISLYDGNGHRITTGVTFASSPAQWQANASPTPSGWPVVTLGAMGAKHNAAQVRIRWTNWCPQGRAMPLWRVSIPGSSTVEVINGMETAGAPPCNGPGQPARVEVGPFEPAA